MRIANYATRRGVWSYELPRRWLGSAENTHLAARIGHLAHSPFPVLLPLQRQFAIADGHEGA